MDEVNCPIIEYYLEEVTCPLCKNATTSLGPVVYDYGQFIHMGTEGNDKGRLILNKTDTVMSYYWLKIGAKTGVAATG